MKNNIIKLVGFLFCFIFCFNSKAQKTVLDSIDISDIRSNATFKIYKSEKHNSLIVLAYKKIESK